MKKNAKTSTRALRRCAAVLLTLALFYVVSYAVGCRLAPPRHDSGAVWSDYLAEQKDSVDVLFFGSSRVYCDVIPAEIYAQSGVTSFVMAGPSQTTAITWPYVLESLKTQSPKLIFVEVSGAFYRQYEEFSLANVCYMPFSANRFRAAAACEDGILTSAIFPLYAFHDRVYEPAAWLPDTETKGRMLCGYTLLEDAAPQQPDQQVVHPCTVGDGLYDSNMDYLRRIAALCAEKDIRLVFYFAPTNWSFTDAEMDALFAELRAMPCEAALDLRGAADELGIDPDRDWYDAIHFNLAGARKFSRYLADYIVSLGLAPSENVDAALWQQRMDYLEAR